MPFILIALAAFVFWPRYDLQLQTSTGHWYVAEENILTLDACRESAAKRARYSYLCMKWSKWSEWTNDWTKYDSKHH